MRRLVGHEITDPLFEPLRVRRLSVANRFVMSPANRNASPGGVPGEDTAQFYRRRVDGETGLIITGGVGVDHPAALGASYGRPCAVPEMHGAAALAGWRRALDVVHEGGGKIVPQLWHMGNMRAAGTGYHPEAVTSSPSGIWSSGNTRTFVPPADVEQFSAPIPALTDAEIVAIIEGYARSARNAAELGFDGIAIHGGNGYLVDSFLWGETNRRTDRWGGSLRERTRFAVELVRAIRGAVGDELPIFFRFSQWKHQDLDGKNAVTPAELEAMLGPIADAGVDVFDGGQYVFDQPAFPGSDLNLAGWAKKLTGRMSMTVGSVGFTTGFYDPDASAPPTATDNLDPLVRRFEDGEFDLVAVCRSLLVDAAWTRKARLGLPFEPYNEAALFAMT